MIFENAWTPGSMKNKEVLDDVIDWVNAAGGKHDGAKLKPNQVKGSNPTIQLDMVVENGNLPNGSCSSGSP